MLTCLVLLALFASVQGRAVNISNTWVLPEEGFPVFYRYFRDRISWYEADAVCQFHHANLVTVDTTAQYDAVRAYLKELDISSAVWVGLIRSNPDGDFTWTDYRGLSGDGYWSSAPDARDAPLCAAADPAADYRWEARACGGPTVASFICELPVPQWALGTEGCMVRELPALTILYLPESAAVQLTADCGLAGVKRVQCTGNVKRENLLRDLSCNDEEELSSTSSPLLGGSTWSVSDITFNSSDFETTDVTTEEDLTTEHETKATQASPTPTPVQDKLPVKQQPVVNKLNNMYPQKNMNLDLMHNNNLQSNDIPKLANTENFLTVEQSEKLEDEKHMHHKMLHDELAKHANFETIFTQPNDHFVPPLVMAKSKISDDMTVLSIAEKHAQQLAEQGLLKHNLPNDRNVHGFENSKVTSKSTTESLSKIEISDKPIVITLQPVNTKESIKKDKVKSLPKKYIEKYEDPKGRALKIDGKMVKFDKPTERTMITSDVTTKITETTVESKTNLEDSMELTVILKQPNRTITPVLSTESTNMQNDENKEEKLVTTENIVSESTLKITPNVYPDKLISHEITQKMKAERDKADLFTTYANTEIETVSAKKTTTEAAPQTVIQGKPDISMNHEIVKITVINDDDNVTPTQTVFEISTLVPEFKDSVNKDNQVDHSTVTSQSLVFSNKGPSSDSNSITSAGSTTTLGSIIMSLATEASGMFTTSRTKVESLPSKENEVTSELPVTTTKTQKASEAVSAILDKNQTKQEEKHNISSTSVTYTTMKEKTGDFNLTEIYEDEGKNGTDIDMIDDLNSPLLSAANEPLHRPNRSRRPQTPPRLNKFNPFRILG